MVCNSTLAPFSMSGWPRPLLTEAVFTQGDTWTALQTKVKEVVTAHYFDLPKPQMRCFGSFCRQRRR